MRFLTILLLALVSTPSWAGFDCETSLVQLDPSNSVREWKNIQQIVVGTFNIEDFFMHVDPHPASRFAPQANKPESKIIGVAKAIDDIRADIWILEEVENRMDVVREFLSKYVKTQYTPILLVGNDPRGIAIVGLIKNDLPVWVEVHSYRKQHWMDPRTNPPHQAPLFSRDLPVFLIRAKGQPQSDDPLLIVAGTHYKSKHQSAHHNHVNSGIADADGTVERAAQIERSAEIIAEYKKMYGNALPIVLAGDFNGDVNSDPHFDPLIRQGLTNAFNLLPSPLTPEQRVSEVFFPNHGAPIANQLDAVFVSEGLGSSVLDGKVYRYDEKPLPTTRAEHQANPSDHWPVSVTLNAKAIVDRLPPTVR